MYVYIYTHTHTQLTKASMKRSEGSHGYLLVRGTTFRVFSGAEIALSNCIHLRNVYVCVYVYVYVSYYM